MRIVLTKAASHRIQRCRLQPTVCGGMAKSGHQVGGEGRSQKPPAKQHGLRGGSPCTPGLGGANKMLDATLRGSRQ